MAPGECGHLQLGVGLLQGYFHQTAGASLNADDQTLVASAQAARLNRIERVGVRRAYYSFVKAP